MKSVEERMSVAMLRLLVLLLAMVGRAAGRTDAAAELVEQYGGWENIPGMHETEEKDVEKPYYDLTRRTWEEAVAFCNDFNENEDGTRTPNESPDWWHLWEPLCHEQWRELEMLHAELRIEQMNIKKQSHLQIQYDSPFHAWTGWKDNSLQDMDIQSTSRINRPEDIDPDFYLMRHDQFDQARGYCGAVHPAQKTLDKERPDPDEEPELEWIQTDPKQRRFTLRFMVCDKTITHDKYASFEYGRTQGFRAVCVTRQYDEKWQKYMHEKMKGKWNPNMWTLYKPHRELRRRSAAADSSDQTEPAPPLSFGKLRHLDVELDVDDHNHY